MQNGRYHFSFLRFEYTKVGHLILITFFGKFIYRRVGSASRWFGDGNQDEANG